MRGYGDSSHSSFGAGPDSVPPGMASVAMLPSATRPVKPNETTFGPGSGVLPEGLAGAWPPSPVAYPAAHARTPRTRGSAAGTGRAAAAAALRQAGTAAVLVDPRLPACAGARAAPRRRPHGVQRGVPPAPTDLVCERRTDGDGQRGRVRRAWRQ